jgi:hypothetical protein
MGVLLKKLSFTLTKLENIHIEIVDGDSSKKTFLHPNQVGKYSH